MDNFKLGSKNCFKALLGGRSKKNQNEKQKWTNHKQGKFR